MADIAIVLKDLFSGKLNSITNANKGLSKSMEETQKKAEAYSKKLNGLNTNLAKQQTQLQKVTKELKEAKKAFDECADAANSDALTETIKCESHAQYISHSSRFYRMHHGNYL